jgi:tetratricopeptide (TPR) repeat protein
MATLYEANLRHARYFYEVLRDLADQYNTSNNPQTILQIVDQSWGQIQKGQEWSAALSTEDENAQILCLSYSDAGDDLLIQYLHPSVFIKWLNQALLSIKALESEKQSNAQKIRKKSLRTEYMKTLRNIGYAHKRLCDYDLALKYYREAQAIGDELGDQIAKATLLDNQATVLKQLGDYEKAKFYVEKALKIAERHGSENILGNIHMDLGIVYFHLDEYQMALAQYEVAETLFTKIKSEVGIAKVKGNRARVLDALHERDSASNEYSASLEIYKKHGNRSGEATSLLNIGMNNYYNGNYLYCTENLQKALPLSRGVGDPLTEGQALLFIGMSQAELGNLSESFVNVKEAYLVLQNIDKASASDQMLQGIVKWISEHFPYEIQLKFWKSLENISYKLTWQKGFIFAQISECYIETKKYDLAEDYLLKAKQLIEDPISFGNIDVDYTCCLSLSRLYMETARFEDAEEQVKRAYTISDAIKMKEWQIHSMMMMGNIKDKKGQKGEAIGLFKSAFQLCVEQKNPDMASACLHSMGNIAMEINKPSLAYEFYEKSLMINNEYQYVEKSCIDKVKMGTALAQMGDFIGAIDLVEDFQGLLPIIGNSEFLLEVKALLQLWKLQIKR